MKNIASVLFAFAVLFSSCLAWLPKIEPVPEIRLTALPTPPHKRPVQIIFPGEAPPTRPYVKIKVLSAKRTAGYPTTNIVQELANQAQDEGADAILVLGKNVYAQTDMSTTTTVDSNGVNTSSSSTTWEWQDVSALAIKYLDNVDYLPDFVREMQIRQWTDTGWVTAASGQVQYREPVAWQPSGGTWLDFWRLYDPETLLPAGLKERLKYADGNDGRRVSAWFNRPELPRPTRRYRLRLDDASRVNKIEIHLHYPEKEGTTEIIDYHYDQSGRLTGRRLQTQAWGAVDEQWTFDEKGKVRQIDWTRAGQPFLRMAYVYYQPEDLKLFAN